MNLTDLSIKRPVFAWTLMIGIIFFGLICYQRLGVSYLPDIDYPTLEIDLTWTGAAPEVLESELVDPIEQKVVSVEGVREIHSVINQGYAEIELDMSLGRNVDAALQEVEANLQQVKYPINVDPPVIRKRNIEDDPILRVVIYGDRPLRDMADFVDKNLQTTLQTVEGVGDVSLGGFGTRNLRLWIDNKKLKQYQLTILDVQQAIQAQHEETAGGYLENGNGEINVRTMGEGLTVAQVGDELLLKRGGESIYNSSIHIRDVARVEDGLSDLRSILRFDGKPAISVDIKKQRGYNEIEVADRVRAEVDNLQRTLPPGMHAEVVVDYTRFTKQAVEQTLHELIIACFLTSITCYLFLGNWTSAVNVLIAIPTSIMGAFMALYFFHFTLNLFTLVALALATGIVVDDAIMVLENIVRHFHMGRTPEQAARAGTHEISFAAIAATIAIVAIFLPIALMSGVIGYFFFQFALTMIVAVLFSLLESLTLTPMRASKLLRRGTSKGYLVGKVDSIFQLLARAYHYALQRALDHRWAVLGLSFGLFLLSLGAFTLLRQELVPPQDQNFIRIMVQAPIGSSMSRTDGELKRIEAYLQQLPEVAHYVSTTGHDNNANEGRFDVVLIDKSKRKLSQSDLIRKFRQDFKNMPELNGTLITYRDLSARGLSTRAPDPVAFNIRGLDYHVLVQLTGQIMDKLNATGLVTDLNTDYREGMPEAQILPDRAAAAASGISIDSIAQTVNVAIGGTREGKFTSGGHRYDILLRLIGEDRITPADIQNLDVRTQYGELVPLAQVTKIDVHPTLQTVARINRQRAISVSGNLAPGVSQAEALAKAEQISQALLPPGYEFYLEGSAQGFQSSLNGLWETLLLGIVVAYLVLAVQFNSFLHPLSVLLALPFSFTGALIALWVTNESINIFSMIGIILLMGIAKKNSILLVEFTNHIREVDKHPLRMALLEACPIRLRPILMTSLATIASAIPLALGWGPGAETRMPMATAVIGGILVSTCFTLFVVPCAYSLLAGGKSEPASKKTNTAVKDAQIQGVS